MPPELSITDPYEHARTGGSTALFGSYFNKAEVKIRPLNRVRIIHICFALKKKKQTLIIKVNNQRLIIFLFNDAMTGFC